MVSSMDAGLQRAQRDGAGVRERQRSGGDHRAATDVAISPLAAVQEGGSGSFMVRLTTVPTADVTIAVSSDNPAVTVAPMSLTFTADNYGTLQTVTVMAAEDDD